MTFEGKTDRQLYVEMRHLGDELASRYEGYMEIVPTRPAELDIARKQLGSIKIAERAFRGFYERCRNVREELEDLIIDVAEAEPPERTG